MASPEEAGVLGLSQVIGPAVTNNRQPIQSRDADSGNKEVHGAAARRVTGGCVSVTPLCLSRRDNTREGIWGCNNIGVLNFETL
jgi:hypothetical protein